MKTNQLVRASIVTALYVILTYSLPSLAYGPIQFRVSEVITLLAYIDSFYIFPLTLGCALANIGSPLGIVDVIFGTLSSFLALYCMSKTKNMFLASLWPAIFSFIIGLEILFLSEVSVNFFIVTGQIMLSQFIIVSIIGVPIFKLIKKNDYLLNMLKDN
ncbi:MAG TPA: QueT transporter family protein [Thermoanaerobacterales bacterium]|nr:QueT transporter family protein [Thermoanaerobacterales bacterium]